MYRYANGEALRGDSADANGRPKVAKTGKKRTAATINRTRAALSSIFKFAIKGQGYLTSNPVLAVAYK